MRLAGKIAVVTGGARGLGAAAARAMADEGAAVVITDVLVDRGRQTVRELTVSGARVAFHELDVRDEARWKDVLDAVEAEFGALHILVNNAGVTTAQTIEETTLDDFRRVFDINLIGCFLGMKSAIPHLKRAGGGAIINIASNSTRAIVPLCTAYSPSKAAVANLTQVVAVHCAQQRYGIRVNSIHPGPSATDMLLGGERHADNPVVVQLIKNIPMGRLGEPSEIGKAVVYLASDDASYVTGAELFIDGGLALL